MVNVLIALSGLFFGFLAAFLLFKRNQKQNALLIMLNDFKKTIDDYKTQSELNAKEVKEAVKTASELTKVLTTNQNLKGQFGEDCLEQVLRAIYPNQNIDYIKQFETQNEDNKKIKPDYLINLPNNKNILIDCKLNLEKYLKFKENPDKKADFIKDLNSTINSLSNKKYQTADFSQPDFILMYIPLEPVITTIYTDKDLIGVVKNANEKNIIMVGTSSVLTVLRLTKLLWAQDRQDKNIDKIINCAESIYDLIALHSQNLSKMKELLTDNLNSFNKEYEKLQTENKLFKTAQSLRELGIEANFKKVGKKLNEIEIHADFLK